MRKTFITRVQDKPGSFLMATGALLSAGVNITRVSYNKAIDTNLLFIDVAGSEESISVASEQLQTLGYLSEENASAKVI
ncbi:MAG TPA: Zn-dependent hydrolase, partial [Spirochaetota bacterium]|nr:Zn-dependent hydrolase [Spirochaetota bacterium]